MKNRLIQLIINEIHLLLPAPCNFGGRVGYKTSSDFIKFVKFCILCINPLTPELNPSAQSCLTRFFGDFAALTVHFVNICVKTNK
jgi:hypothetical protein